ncbi:MAG: hypothetical protein BWY46_01536 [Firmicutes bacterium ADurb.Bin300]|nr:MAG: hypothetical protein BWY46_01536 [Firmicutes bacterium ADurb.Bin300]
MAQPKHCKNQYVMCRDEVCKIAEIKKMNLAGAGNRTYYIVEPINEEGSRTYIPVDFDGIDSAMRVILSVDEINAIIEQSAQKELPWIKDAKERVSSFEQILQSADRAKILCLLKMLKAKKREVESEKKKLYMGDLRILERARKMITEEFSFVLGLEKSEVEPYVSVRLDSSDA